MAKPYAETARRLTGAAGSTPSQPRKSNAIMVGQDDHRPFIGETDVADLDRLVRYVPNAEDETGSFAPLKAKALEGVERIYVFVHGWVPGSKADADLLYATEGEVVAAWDPRARNAHGISLVEAYVPLLDALARRDEDAAVLWFSWVDQSGTDTGLFSARNSLHATAVNGRRLALALTQATGKDSPRVHLIGHSHGCIVSTHAALSLSRKPDQLTLLDCPEDWFSRAGGAAGLLEHLLPRLQPGRAPGSTFVDSYASMFGRTYHDRPGLADVVDVWLPPKRRPDDTRSTVSYNHHYAVEWYAETVTDADAPAGYAWTRLNGYDPAELDAGYLVTGSGRLVRTGERPEAGGGQSNPAYVVESVIGSVAELTAKNPDVLVSLDPGDDAVLLEFDYELGHAGRKTRVEAAINRSVSFTASRDFQVPSRGRYLRLPADSGEVQVQFRLANAGMRDSVRVGRLRVVRGEHAPHNLNDLQAMQVSAALGFGTGVIGTLVAVGVVGIGRRLMRALRS